MATADNSTRLAILVAEDDLLLAADVEDAIRSCGHACLGPVGSLSEVFRLIEAARVDAAILDISLRHGERVYPAADLLAARDIPFAFVTAYRSTHLDQRYAGCRTVEKPVTSEQLELLVEELTRRRSPSPAQSLPAQERWSRWLTGHLKLLVNRLAGTLH